MAAKKGMFEPKADKAIKAAVAEKAPSGKRIDVASVGSVRIMDGAALIVVDGKQQMIEGNKVAIVIEG